MTKLRKVGGSTMLAVPPALLDLLQMQTGTSVEMDVVDGRLQVEPHPLPHYELDELLAQCKPASKAVSEERVWLEAKPVGRELL